jgi:hypothetical protein
MQNLNDILIQAAGGEVSNEPEPVIDEDTTGTEPENTPGNDPENTPGTEPGNEPEPDTGNPGTNEDPNKNKKNPMKDVRDRLTQEQKARERVEKTIQRFTEGDYKFKIRDFKTEDGKVDYEALQKAMDDADMKARAETKGVSPEIQAEIERIEQEKLELRKEKLRVQMDRELSNMQVELQLNKEDINVFFKDALAINRNPYQWLAQGGNLNDLYFLIYKDRIIQERIDKEVSDAKSKWEAANKKQAPVSNPATPSQSTNVDGVSLSDLLSSAVKK